MNDTPSGRSLRPSETPEFGVVAERLRRAGEFDRAIEMCREGLKKFPKQMAARVTLGRALADNGEFDAAAAELAQVLREAPDNLAAIRGLADLNERTELPLEVEDAPSSAPEPSGERSVAAEVAPVEPAAPAPGPAEPPKQTPIAPRAPRLAAFSAHVPGASLGVVRVPRPPVRRPVSLLPQNLAADSTQDLANQPTIVTANPTETNGTSAFASLVDVDIDADAGPASNVSPFASLEFAETPEPVQAASSTAPPADLAALERLLQKVKRRQSQIDRESVA